MLLIIISIFLLHDLYNCVIYEKANFDEFLLIKQHHQNFLQIKDFIKKAQHKFHEERAVLRVGGNEPDSTRDDEFLNHSITNWWWNNTSSTDQLGLYTPQTFLLPSIRSRSLFLDSITPYTTELNNRHLKWDEIFPTHSIYTRPSESSLRIGPQVSSTPKNSAFQRPPSKTLIPGPKKKIPFGPTFRVPKSHNTTSTSPNTSVTGHSVQPFAPSTTIIIPNEEYKKIWLRDITKYTPFEIWFKTLRTQTGMRPSNDYTKQYSETPAPTSRKSRRFNSKARKRKHQHHLQERYKAGERHLNNRYLHSAYSNEDIYQWHEGDEEYRMLKLFTTFSTEGRRRFSMNTPKHPLKRLKKVTRPKQNQKHTEPTGPPKAMFQLSEPDDTEDEKLMKLIDSRDEARHKKTVPKEKTAFYHQVIESLKQAESKRKAKRLKLKAELLRKIVEGSNYSDEEASLKKNLIRALQYGNGTFEHDVAWNRRDTMKRIIR